MSRRTLIAFAAAGLLTATVSPAPAQKLLPAAGSLVAHDANRVFLRVSNRGGIGLSLSRADVGNFPRGTDNRYLFGAGVWVGGIGEVDDDATPDSLVTIGYNPDRIGEIEWIEGAIGFNRDDARFRVLDSTEPADESLFPAEPVADQELFTMYGDRFSVIGGARASIPLGVEVRQRSFAFDEPGLDGAIFFQWDLMNVSDRIRERGHEIEGLVTGIVLDPDIGAVDDDAAAPLSIDGGEVLLVWDADFFESFFDGSPGFLAIVPLEEPDEVVVTQLESGGDSRDHAAVQDVPQTDAAQYRAMVGVEPNAPTVRRTGFDLRALVAWGRADLSIGDVHRAAAALVFAGASGAAPEPLEPTDFDRLTQDEPLLADLVAAVRSARVAYAERLASLPALLDFPGTPAEPTPGEGNRVLQNYPNPFRDRTTVEYNVAEAARIRIDVLDLTGSLVTTLVDGSTPPGRHTVSWSGVSATGIAVPAGIYVIRMTTNGGGETSVRALKRP